MLAFVIFAVVFVTFLLVALIYLYPSSTKVTTIPGLNPSNKELGNIPDIQEAGSLHEFLSNLHGDHGKIASFWYNQQLCVSIADPDLYKEVKMTFDKPSSLYRLFEPLLTEHGLEYVNGREARDRRNATDSFFSPESLVRFFDVVNEVGKGVVEKLKTLPKDEHIPLCQYSLAINAKALGQMLFGDYFKDDRKCFEFKKIYELCWHELESQLSGDGQVQGSDRDKKFEAAKTKLFDILKEIVAKRKSSQHKSEDRLFIDELVDNEKIYNDDSILADALSYYVGGYHTCGTLLAWTLYFITTHEAVYKKIQEEILEVIGGQGQLKPEHIKKLKYMKQTIDESARLSVLSTFTSRVHEVDIELAGHIVPKGTPVIQALGVTLQDEELWPNVNSFDPDRFSHENNKDQKEFSFCPFGIGKRICPGYQFSYLEVSIFLVHLLTNFEWSLVDGQVVEPKYSFITRPAEEVWMLIKKCS